MAKLCNLLDEVPELEKRVYALRLLADVDFSSLTQSDSRNWLGLFLDCVDLLDRTTNDIRMFADAIQSAN